MNTPTTEVLLKMLDMCGSGMLMLNKEHKIVTINEYGAHVFGYKPNELIGKDLDILIENPALKHADMMHKFMDRSTAEDRYTLGDGRVILAKNRNMETIRLAIDVFKLDDEHAVARFDDYHDEINLDSLTGTLTRRAFFNEASFIVDHFSLIFIDLNKFKAVNDGPGGHSAGDQVLAVVAKRLQHLLRDSDIVCRYGGDEFVILINKTISTKVINMIMDKIYDAINKPIFTDAGPQQISCSMGYATSLEASDIDDIIHLADQRMYKDKNFIVKETQHLR